MNDNPRLRVLFRWAPHSDGARSTEWAKTLMAILDDVDPLRRPVSQDRVEAALGAFYGEPRHQWHSSTTAAMTRALAAADRVQPPAEPEATPTADGESAWNDLIRATVAWAERMDQWTKFQFPTKFGNVFVTLSRMAEFPDEFTPATPNETKPAEKPDFPPWSREMWILLHYLAQKCQGQHPVERETMSYLLDQARRATVPETQDAG